MINKPQHMEIILNFKCFRLPFAVTKCVHICFSFFKVREEKVKPLTPREAGYAIQLSNKTLLDVRPSTEHKKVRSFSFCLFFSKQLFHIQTQVNILSMLPSSSLVYSRNNTIFFWPGVIILVIFCVYQFQSNKKFFFSILMNHDFHLKCFNEYFPFCSNFLSLILKIYGESIDSLFSQLFYFTPSSSGMG